MSGTEPAKIKPPAGRMRRVGRTLFRISRTALVVVVLIAAVFGLFLNKVGLPEVAKNRVIAQARAKGLEVQFSRLRLRWYRGIVAEHLQIKSANEPLGPQVFVDEAESPLNVAALRNLELRMNSLRLRGGRVIWPLPTTNGLNRTFVLNDLHGQLFFEEDGRWDLHSLFADFHGV